MQKTSLTHCHCASQRLVQRNTFFKLKVMYSQAWARTGQMCLKERWPWVWLTRSVTVIHRGRVNQKKTYSPTSELLNAESDLHQAAAPVFVFDNLLSYSPLARVPVESRVEGRGGVYWRNNFVASHGRTFLKQRDILATEEKGTKCSPLVKEICPEFHSGTKWTGFCIVWVLVSLLDRRPTLRLPSQARASISQVLWNEPYSGVDAKCLAWKSRGKCSLRAGMTFSELTLDKMPPASSWDKAVAELIVVRLD